MAEEKKSNVRRKKLLKINQGSIFFGGSFSNGDHVRAPIQIRTESQPQHLKRLFFLMRRPTHPYTTRLTLIKIIVYLVLDLEMCFSIFSSFSGLVMGAMF